VVQTSSSSLLPACIEGNYWLGSIHDAMHLQVATCSRAPAARKAKTDCELTEMDFKEVGLGWCARARGAPHIEFGLTVLMLLEALMSESVCVTMSNRSLGFGKGFR
jgi:hypothetical protein